MSAARRYVEEVLHGLGASDAAWTCAQLISELATNAVIHARTDFTVEVSRRGDLIRACVRDASPAAPAVRRYAEDSTTGRGLRLVESMAADWGVQRSGLGKIIWFEIDTGRRSSAQSWDDGTEVDLDALLGQFSGDEDDAANAHATPAVRDSRVTGRRAA